MGLVSNIVHKIEIIAVPCMVFYVISPPAINPYKANSPKHLKELESRQVPWKEFATQDYWKKEVSSDYSRISNNIDNLFKTYKVKKRVIETIPLQFLPNSMKPKSKDSSDMKNFLKSKWNNVKQKWNKKK